MSDRGPPSQWRSKKLNKLKQRRSDSIEETTESLERSMRVMQATSRQLPWLVGLAAVMTLVSAVAAVYVLSTAVLHTS